MALFSVIMEMENAYKPGNLFFNEDDIFLNFDKFKNNKSNVILITGYSGSGKSTLGKALAKTYKAEFVEMDMFTCFIGPNGVNYDQVKMLKQNYPTIYKWFSIDNSFEEFNKTIHLLKEQGSKAVYNYIEKETTEFLNWAIFKTKKRLIIEGTCIPYYLANTISARSLPIIFKGTSKYGSLYRRIKREWNFNEFVNSNIINEIIETLKWYDIQEVEMNFAKLLTYGE